MNSPSLVIHKHYMANEHPLCLASRVEELTILHRISPQQRDHHRPSTENDHTGNHHISREIQRPRHRIHGVLCPQHQKRQDENDERRAEGVGDLWWRNDQARTKTFVDRCFRRDRYGNGRSDGMSLAKTRLPRLVSGFLAGFFRFLSPR